MSKHGIGKPIRTGIRTRIAKSIAKIIPKIVAKPIIKVVPKKRPEASQAPLASSKTSRKPKVTQKWSSDDVRALIQAVEPHPCIWDLNHEDHKNLIKRNASWDTIVLQLENRFDVVECKGKWVNTRNAYYVAKKNMEQMKSGQATEIKERWAYSDDMNFLTKKDAVTNTTSASNFVLPIDDDNNSLASIATTISFQSTTASGSGIAERKRKSQSTHSSVTSTEGRSTAVQRAINTLSILESTTDDEWTVMGNYLASLTRTVAKTDAVAADRLNRRLTRVALEFMDEFDQAQAPITYQIVQDPSMPPGTVHLVSVGNTPVTTSIVQPITSIDEQINKQTPINDQNDSMDLDMNKM